MKHTAAYQEKNQAAASSVLAAIGLTTLKIVVGVLTGSLGILAEAAHSALDLAAALMTWFAVRISGKPPDRNHPYGHGKAENLSAYRDAASPRHLRLGRLQRIGAPDPRPHRDRSDSVVLRRHGVLDAVDYSRSRMLSAAAKKHDSRALEADALHFSTDIWSSAVVIVGLACVKLSELHPEFAFLKRADAFAALIVAGIVFFVSGELGLRTVQGLLDAAPKGLEERIKSAAETVPGIVDCHQVRARFSGAQLFVDAHVLVDGALTLAAAHALTDEVEAAIQRNLPGADVTVHAEPVPVPAP